VHIPAERSSLPERRSGTRRETVRRCQSQTVARMNAEEEVRTSEERLKSIISSAMDAIITLDDQQRILLFNATVAQMFRCSAEESIGSIASSRKDFELYTPSTSAASAKLESPSAAGAPWRRFGQCALMARSAARRLMQENGVRADQVSQVRGFANQMLRKPEDAQDPSNRRISLIVPVDKKEKPEESEETSRAENGAVKAVAKEH
jgi:transcriptional regulator with PAS, ATPase and Fis domain